MTKYLELVEQTYNEIIEEPKPNKDEYMRQVVTCMNGEDYSLSDFKCALCACLPKTAQSNLSKDISIEKLNELYKKYYALAIGYNNNKPVIEECYGAWLNLDSYTLSSTIEFNTFSCEEEREQWVFIPDWRKDNSYLTWKDIVPTLP